MKCLLLACVVLLTACAARTPLPVSAPALTQALPLSLQVNTADDQDWLLVIQAEGEALRLSLFDPLGVPLARQSLAAGTWHNDGLLPPNPKARELFAVLLFALTPAERLAQNYGQQGWQQSTDSRQLAPHWQISYGPQQVIELDNGSDRYRISPLESQP